MKAAVSSETSVSTYTNADFKTQTTKIEKIRKVRPLFCLFIHKRTRYSSGKLL